MDIDFSEWYEKLRQAAKLRHNSFYGANSIIQWSEIIETIQMYQEALELMTNQRNLYQDLYESLYCRCYERRCSNESPNERANQKQS